MSFLKKIQKVLALWSPWGTVKPSKKRRKKTRAASKKHANKRSNKRHTAAEKKVLLLKISKKITNKSPLKKVKEKTEAKKVVAARKALQRKITVPQTKKTGVKATRGSALNKTKLKRVLVGEVTHYFDRAKVGAFMITGAPIVLGDALEFEGKWGVFRQEIKSLQIDRVPVKSARAGDEVGILVKKPVKEGDYVFKVL